MPGLVHVRYVDLARPPRAGRSPHAAFVGVTALLFGTSATLTAYWASSMSAMPGMPMSGGWTMSMVWMGLPGETWVVAVTTFLEMWVVMMVAMMLPASAPMLWRYQQALSRIDARRREWLTGIAGTGYFTVWTVLGVVVYVVGTLLTTIAMSRPEVARLVPIASGIVVVCAGALELSPWKARRLTDCREHPEPARTQAEDVGSAWRHGLRLGCHCALACANLMAVALVFGMMDLRSMATVAAAIMIERLSSTRANATRLLGGAVVGLGLLLMARAVEAR